MGLFDKINQSFLKKTPPQETVTQVRSLEEQKLDDEFLSSIDFIAPQVFYEERNTFDQESRDKFTTGSKKIEKEWENKSWDEQQQLYGQWKQDAFRKALEKNRDYYLKLFQDYKNQEEEKFSTNYNNVLNRVDINPEMKETYKSFIGALTTLDSGWQFAVTGIGDVRGVHKSGGGGCRALKFSPIVKGMVDMETQDRFGRGGYVPKNESLKELNRVIIPLDIYDQVPKDNEGNLLPLFEEKIGFFRMDKENKKLVFYSQRAIQGKKGNEYIEETRGGSGYTLVLELNLDRNPNAIQQLQMIEGKPITNLSQLLDMLADTFIPGYNHAIKELAKEFNEKFDQK